VNQSSGRILELDGLAGLRIDSIQIDYMFVEAGATEATAGHSFLLFVVPVVVICDHSAVYRILMSMELTH
jgi:hypothetical protein